MKSPCRPSSRSLHGLSLVELAIVLGVAGAILGGIWSIAAIQLQNAKQQVFSKQLNIMATNLRGAYASQPYMPTTRADITTAALQTMNAFPITIDAPFGPAINPLSASSPYTSMYACGWPASSAQLTCDFSNGTSHTPLFAVEALVPIGSACINAVMNNTNTATIAGLENVVINGVNLRSSGSTTTLPPALSWVETHCAAAYPGSTTVAVVDFVFRLVP